MGAYQGGFLTNLLEFQQFQTKFKLFYDTITVSFYEGFFKYARIGAHISCTCSFTVTISLITELHLLPSLHNLASLLL